MAVPHTRLYRAVALLGLAGCGAGDGEHPPGSADGARPNLLLISIDTLRADHLGFYGYERPTSPALDSFAAGAVVFESAQASAPWTLPALASVMTSYFSSTHACWSFNSALSPSFPTLAELLRDDGYDTACIVSHIALARSYGLQQGFVHFDDEYEYPAVSGLKAKTSKRVSDLGVRWFEDKAAVHDGVPWFLWVHYFDPHGDYMAHEGISEQFGLEQELDLYDGEIRFTDGHVGRLLAGLAASGLADETVVAFVADHGEEFQDHGGTKHGHTLYGELVRVPLAIRVPGVPPRRVPGTVRTVDLAPTLLELCGVALSVGGEGRSLASVLRGAEYEPEPALAEVRLKGKRHSFESLVFGKWKLIQPAEGSAELYDLDADPTERTDVARRHKDVVTKLRRRLQSMVASAERAAARFDPPNTVELTAGDEDELRGLGYIGDEE